MSPTDRASASPGPPKLPLIDPTANVLALVKAETQRQDDLRTLETKRLNDLSDQKAAYDEKLNNLRASMQVALAQAESRRVDGISAAEARRLDALLEAATTNVALAAEKANAQALALAAQVTAAAEQQRNQSVSVANSNATLISQLNASIDNRFKPLEQNLYQGAGIMSQRVEGKAEKQWVVGLIVVLAAAIGQVLAHFLK